MCLDKFWMVLVGGIAALLVSSCGGVNAVESAAEEYVAPEGFILTESETLNGFEEVQRVFDYSTDLAGAEACELGRHSLEEWAGAPAELLDTQSPGSFCRYEVRLSPNFPEIDFAAVSVKRRTDVADALQRVSRVVVFFSVDK